MPLLRPAFFGLPSLMAVLALPACGGGGDSNGGPDGGALEPVTCPREPSVCGNSAVEPGESCEPPGTATCDADCQRIPAVAPDPACDMTGHWAVQKVTVSAATILPDAHATTRNYLYYHIVQDGDSLEVVHSVHCGFDVEAPIVSASISLDTRRALRCINDSNGRTGSYSVSDDACDLRFDTFYVVRGLSPRGYWLDDDWAPSEGMMQSAPSKAPPEDPNCTCDMVTCDCDDVGRHDPGTGAPGWEDWDRDALPGITIRPGRDSKWGLHMRDWDRFLGTTAQSADEFQVDVEWWNVSGIMAWTVGAIVTEEAPALSANHYVVFKRIEAPDRNDFPANSGDPDQGLCDVVIGSF
jgi:hypothetical protein